MTYEDAIQKLRHQFHKTRITNTINVDAEIIYAILYKEPSKAMFPKYDK